MSQIVLSNRKYINLITIYGCICSTIISKNRHY